MRLSKRERILVFGTLVLGLLFLFIYYYYMPLKDKVEDLKVQSEDLDYQIDEKKQKKVLVDSLKKEIKVLEKRAQESERYFMASIDEPEILYYMNGFLSDKTMKQSLEYKEVEDLEVYKHKDISLEYNTSYGELKEILRQFEGGEYYTTLQSFKLSVDGSLVGKYEIDEKGAIIVKEKEKTPYNLNIEHEIRYYGLDATWDGTGEYEFMKGAKFYSD